MNNKAHILKEHTALFLIAHGLNNYESFVENFPKPDFYENFEDPHRLVFHNEAQLVVGEVCFFKVFFTE